MNIKERIRKMGPFIALVVTFIVIAALNDSFVDPNNLKNLLRQVSINALISFGMTFVILTGGIDLSVGSLLALSSALMGSLIVSGMNPMLAILAACFIGMGLGAVNGLVIAYGKVAPFIATLATMTIYRGLTLVYTNGNPISGLSDDTMFHDFGQGFFMGLPVPAIIMLLAFAVSWFILRKTPLGRSRRQRKSFLHRRHQNRTCQNLCLCNHRFLLRSGRRSPHLTSQFGPADCRHRL